jgi:hypothetical protein
VNEPAEQTSSNPWWLAFRVLDEPRTVFAEIVARPRVLVPFLVLFVFGPLVYAVASPASVFRAQAEQSIAIAERQNPDAMTAERREEMLATAASPAKRATTAATILVVGGLMALAAALILKLIVGAMAPEGVTFKQEFSVLLHGWMPTLFATLLTPILAMAGIEQLQLSLGFLVDSDPGSFLYQFLNGITVFGVWSMMLVAIGNQALLRSDSLSGSLTIVGGLWLFYKVASAGLGSVLGGLTG